MIKIRKLYDPYKQQTFANVEDLFALFKEAREHPENFTASDKESLRRLAEEILGKPTEPERPF